MFEQMNNNKVHLSGKVISEPKLSHQVYDENFYEADLEVSRLSNSVDIIPVLLSEKFIEEYDIKQNSLLTINGQFRSYNKQIDGKSKLVLTVFAREILQNNSGEENPNTIELVGYICKTPVFRTTPFKREICDVLVAVNRAYNKSDYLPCIAWGRNARYANSLSIGEKINIFGRIQSRDYEKKLDNGEILKKTAYEISIIKISKAQDKIDDSLFMANQASGDTTNSISI